MKTNRRPSAARVRKSLASLSAISAIVLLVVYHAVLFWQRVVDLSLFRPIPAIRWLVTLALLIALTRLHRRGVSLIRGRSALVFWLLVLLLHVGFQVPLADPVESLEGLAENAGWLIALPAMAIILGVSSPAIRRLLARVLRGVGLRDLPYVAPFGESQAFTERAGTLPILSRRPPPVPAH